MIIKYQLLHSWIKFFILVCKTCTSFQFCEVGTQCHLNHLPLFTFLFAFSWTEYVNIYVCLILVISCHINFHFELDALLPNRSHGVTRHLPGNHFVTVCIETLDWLMKELYILYIYTGPIQAKNIFTILVASRPHAFHLFSILFLSISHNLYNNPNSVTLFLSIFTPSHTLSSLSW